MEITGDHFVARAARSFRKRGKLGTDRRRRTSLADISNHKGWFMREATKLGNVYGDWLEWLEIGAFSFLFILPFPFLLFSFVGIFGRFFC